MDGAACKYGRFDGMPTHLYRGQTFFHQSMKKNIGLGLSLFIRDKDGFQLSPNIDDGLLSIDLIVNIFNEVFLPEIFW
jgi:hypothetical protein